MFVYHFPAEHPAKSFTFDVLYCIVYAYSVSVTCHKICRVTLE